jgi:hypothetical protein
MVGGGLRGLGRWVVPFANRGTKGKREADELRARIGNAIESEESSVVMHRPDLSSFPE